MKKPILIYVLFCVVAAAATLASWMAYKKGHDAGFEEAVAIEHYSLVTGDSNDAILLVRVLEQLRDDRTDEAIDSLESALDGILSSFVAHSKIEPGLVHDEKKRELLGIVKRYRVAHPTRFSDLVLADDFWQSIPDSP